MLDDQASGSAVIRSLSLGAMFPRVDYITGGNGILSPVMLPPCSLIIEPKEWERHIFFKRINLCYDLCHRRNTEAEMGDHWSIRGVPQKTRQAALEAAKRESLTLGAWLSRTIDYAIAIPDTSNPLERRLSSLEGMVERMHINGENSTEFEKLRKRVAVLERVISSRLR